jgi:cyclopropane-fatty-acyl-phospholipid synthase
MSNQQEVEVSYDVSNDFFRLWLDEKMNYTCALYEGTDNLEEAQMNKLHWLNEKANVGPDTRLLDIGCGWGANIEYAATQRNAKEAFGITLSRAQHEEVMRRKEEQGLDNMDAIVTDYRDFAPDEKFDAVISICMMEHIARPEEARDGDHLDLYRDYFKRVWEWTNPGAMFGLQTILRDKVPRDRQDLKDICWLTYEIFPGGLSLRLEDVVQSVSPYWEIMEIQTRREHYEKTTAEWLRRLRENEDVIREKWGDKVFDDYDRYLRTCVRAFQMRYQSLAQYALRRID